MLEKQVMLDLIIDAYKTDPETGSFAEWLAEYLVERLPTLTQPNEWVSVEDRLPEDYQRVLCLFESGTMEVSFRASVKGFCYEGFKQTGKVTHWIPLPEPPKEE